ncbi:hypothetical protein TNCV_128681 [Trichonephila clavipes]|nr:hypothetical protein TNCV_128681 [Trichonephila clavipes]
MRKLIADASNSTVLLKAHANGSPIFEMRLSRKRDETPIVAEALSPVGPCLSFSSSWSRDTMDIPFTHTMFGVSCLKGGRGNKLLVESHKRCFVLVLDVVTEVKINTWDLHHQLTLFRRNWPIGMGTIPSLTFYSFEIMTDNYFLKLKLSGATAMRVKAYDHPSIRDHWALRCMSRSPDQVVSLK